MQNTLLPVLQKLLVLVTCFSFPLFGQLVNPLPDPIVKSGLSVNLQDFVTVPSSATSAPKARINMLKSAGDGTGRLFVNDLRGKLHVIRNGAITTYLDIAAERSNFNDAPGLGAGFSMFAFHPDFETNGKFYTGHSEDTGSDTPDVDLLVTPSRIDLQWVLSEWTADDPTANTFSGTSREMLRLNTPSYIHGFQDLTFNPNVSAADPDYGMLYLCIGDGGTTGRGYPGNTHDLRSFLGTIIRIDPLGSDGRNGQYGIPADNPFVTAQADTLPEIWAWGFRNPHRISWDTGGDGKMLIGDIGEKNIEEVNIGYAGADYGWNLREGTYLYDYNQNTVVFPLPADDSTRGYTYPVAQYDHDEGVAIVGGFVYRGNRVPDLFGMYVFGDIKNGRVFYAPVDSLVQGSQATIHELTLIYNGVESDLIDIVDHDRADLRFGVDDDNELYILSKVDGMIWTVNGFDSNRQYPLLYEENFALGDMNWSANLPENWQLGSDDEGNFYELTAPGPFGDPRRPTNSSVFMPYTVGNFEMEVVARSNQDSTILARDICLFFGFQDSLRFYYSHFAGQSADVHNIIAIVNDADRVKINVEPAGTTTALLTDFEYHTLKVVRSVDTGSIEAFFDGELIMTAVDTTFTWGQIGIGSFDDVATFRSVKLWGELVTVGVEQISNVPSSFFLKQNYPNPFNPATTIEFGLPEANRVELTIYSIDGRKITTLLAGVRAAGAHRISWDGTNAFGNRVASGVYLYQLKAGDRQVTRKMLLTK